jgi:hypothetical protein
LVPRERDAAFPNNQDLVVKKKSEADVHLGATFDGKRELLDE